MRNIQVEYRRLVVYPEKTPELPWPIGRVACGKKTKPTSKLKIVLKDALDFIDFFGVEKPKIIIATPDDESIFAVWDSFPPEPLNPYDLWIVEDGEARRLELVKTAVAVSSDIWIAHDLLEKQQIDYTPCRCGV